MGVKNKVQSIRKSKDGKVLMENFMSLSLLQVVGYIFPLITLPYLARVIGVDKFGEIAFANSIEIYFVSILMWGFQFTATRDIAQNRDNKDKVSEIFSNVFAAQIVLFIVVSLLYAVCIYTIPVCYKHRVILWATYPVMFARFIFPDWMFQALEKMKFIVILQFAANLLFTVLIFVVIRDKSDYFWHPVVMSIGSIVAGIISLWLIFYRFQIKFTPTFNHIWKQIKSSWDIFLSNIFSKLLQSLHIAILSSLKGDVATGIYSSGQKFYIVTNNFSNVLSRTFFPFLARKQNRHYIYTKISLALSLFMCLALFGTADLLVKIFYTPEFADSAKIIRILSFCPFFYFLSDTYGINYLVLYKKENTYRNINMYCTIVGILAALILIPVYGSFGVALNYTVTTGIIGCLTYLFARNHRRNLNKTNLQIHQKNSL
jgi:PST family polysaccharide transporter